jgi:hypothetical protein
VAKKTTVVAKSPDEARAQYAAAQAATTKKTTPKAPSAPKKITTAKKVVPAPARAAEIADAESGQVSLPTYPVVDPAKQAIAQETTQLSISVDSALNQAQADLDAIMADIAGEQAMAEAEAAAQAATAAAAEAAMQQGDIFKEEGDVFFRKAFYGDTGSSYGDLPASLQSVVSKVSASDAALMAAMSVLSAVGVEGLMDSIEAIRKLYPDISSDDALLLLKYDKRFNEPYLKRFEGNRIRMQKGLPPLDDAEYLANEQAYEKTFKSYDLNQFANRAYYAKLIGDAQPPQDIATKVGLAYDNILKGPAENLTALTKFFKISDIVAYALSPDTMLPKMKQTILASQIGGSALRQGLGTSLEATTFTGAESAGAPTNVQRGTIGVTAMMQAGVDAAGANKAAAYVAGVLPIAEKLSSIYAKGYKQYGQLEAEKEIYQLDAAAKRAGEALEAREIAEFSGQYGGLKSQRRATGGLI